MHACGEHREARRGQEVSRSVEIESNGGVRDRGLFCFLVLAAWASGLGLSDEDVPRGETPNGLGRGRCEHVMCDGHTPSRGPVEGTGCLTMCGEWTVCVSRR